MVVSLAVLVLCADKPLTVKVLPISTVLFAREPGISLPLDICTFVLLSVITVSSSNTSVLLAPSWSEKNSLPLESRSGYLKTA
mgnify:CR=1 FL=1